MMFDQSGGHSYVDKTLHVELVAGLVDFCLK